MRLLGNRLGLLERPRARLWACVAVCVITVGVVGTSATASGSSSSWYKVDTHQHSAFSGDAKADMGIDAQLAQNYGYNAVFLTDHDRGTGFQINWANGNYQSFIDPALAGWKSTGNTVGNSTWTGKPTPSQPLAGALVPALGPPPYANGGGGEPVHLKAAASSSTKIISSMIYSDRGPALNAGDVNLKFSIYPATLTGAGGADVSVSLGGDAVTGPKAIGYTTSDGIPHGLTTPAKSTVLVWQIGTGRKATTPTGLSDVFVNPLHTPTLGTWNQYTIDVTTGVTSWTDGTQSPVVWQSATRLNNLPSNDLPDTRMVVLTYEKMEATVSAAGGVADVYFDNYVARVGVRELSGARVRRSERAA